MSNEELEYPADDQVEVLDHEQEAVVTESAPAVHEGVPVHPHQQEIAQVSQKFVAGANWFFWIAGLSLVNTVLIWSGTDWTFIIGLGATLVADAIARESGEKNLLIIAAVIDVIILGLYVMFGVFARKTHQWAFIVGMIFYALDGLIFVKVGDWLSVGFHVFALYGIYSGWKAIRQLKTLNQPS